MTQEQINALLQEMAKGQQESLTGTLNVDERISKAARCK